MKNKIKYITITAIILMSLIPLIPVDAKAQKISLKDETNDGIQGDENTKGFVIVNQNAKGKLIIVVKTKKIEQVDAELTVELIVSGENTDGGISDTEHYGERNTLGSIETNIVGNGNSHFNIDVETLEGINPDIDMNYGHVDVEDYTDTLGLPRNYYGATPFSWMTQGKTSMGQSRR